MLSLLVTEHQRYNIHDIGASRNLTLAVAGSRSLPVRSWKPWLVTINWLELSLYSDQRNWEKQTRWINLIWREQTVSKRSAACAGAQIRAKC